LSRSFDFPIFKRSNQIETGLFKGESENRQSDRAETLLNPIRLPDVHQVQSFMPLLAFDKSATMLLPST
jgi:hypothetical protein